jgi:4'-phosphopantetheinyl transferase
VPNFERLSARFCSESERDQLHALPESDRETAFLALWTCKEAYLKAVGSGIAMPLKDVEVALDPPRLVRISNDPHAASQWSLLRAGEAGHAVCTIAIRGTGWRLVDRRFEWPKT